MMRHWLRDLKVLFDPKHAPATRAARPRVEALEDRTAPATFTVTNANDDGAGSLRQAIRDANANPGADTITFQASAFPSGSQINLSSGDYHINVSVAIQGPGILNLTVSGAKNLSNSNLFT